MIDTLDMFESPAFVRRTDPSTSRAAAATVNTTELENTVLDALRAFPRGATTYQLAAHLQASLVSISPRMKPLVSKGLVRDSGTRSRGPSGRNQTVWVKT